MKVIFQYDKEKDIWCLLNKGKSSNNSQSATKVYEQLVAKYGENPDEVTTSLFIDAYVADNAISVQEYVDKYQQDWDSVSEQYHKKAQEIFGISLPEDVVGYLTINNRCPYNIEKNYFFVSVPSPSARRTVMHELWHFYTWYGLGADQLQKLGNEKYNELKEALTVLLNVECADLLPEGVQDIGYPQHKEIRDKILVFWKKDRNISNLWKHLTA